MTGRDITAAIVIENLNLHGLIPDELYVNLTSIRKSRNKLLHGLQSITPYKAVKSVIQIHYSIDLLHRGTMFMGNFKYGDDP